MQQRGRRSAESRAVAINAGDPYLEPPDDLKPAEAALFTEIVKECKPSHFVPSDRHLLVAYVQAILLSREAARNMGTDYKSLIAFERASKLMTTLATKLRLAPQSRIDARIAEARTRRQASAALLMRNPNGDGDEAHAS